MAVYKNVASQKLAIYAHDTSADAAKTGDAANITAQISKDGAATAATNDVNPTELDATDAKGIYIFDMTQAETNADLIVLSAVSSTADIAIEPLIIYTTPGDSTAINANAAEWNGTTTTGDGDWAELQTDVDTLVTGVNVSQISGDSAAADKLESALEAAGSAMIAADVKAWNVSATVIDDGVDGNSISFQHASYTTLNLSFGTDITGYSELYFSIKDGPKKLDSESILQIDTSGLKYLDGSEASTATDGSITVTDATAGDITVTIKDDAALYVPINDRLIWDISWVDSSGNKRTPKKGTLDCQWVATKSTS